MTGPTLTKRSLVTAAAGLATASLGGRGWAAEDPGRKVGWAIVGLGSYATRQIMPAFAQCRRSRITALVSGDPAKAQSYAAQYGVPSRGLYDYKTFERLADNPDVDVVYVILPNSLHCEYTVRAARAGKHVVSEKPMAVSVDEGRQMIDACRRAGRKLMIGYRSRFEPYNREAIRICRSGELGRLRTITADHGLSARPGIWRLQRALSGGGSLMDIGIYSLNAARYLSGEEPVEVAAVEHSDRSDPRFREVEDTLAFSLRFPSGVVAECLSTYSSAHNRYRAVGEAGWLDMEPATSYEGQTMRVKLGGPAQPRTVPGSTSDQFAAQLDHMSACVLSGEEPLTPGEEGLRDLRVMAAIYEAAREGRTVRLA